MLMLLMAFQNVNSLMFHRLAYFTLSSQVYRPDGGGGGAVVVRAQRPIAINWGQSRYEKSIIWKFVCQQIVLRHFMVWRVTEPLSSAFTAKWRNQEISTESDPLLSIPWGNMNLRVNEFTPFTRRLCPDVFMAPGCPRLRWAQEAQADPLDNNTKKEKKNMNTNVQRFELPLLLGEAAHQDASATKWFSVQTQSGLWDSGQSVQLPNGSISGATIIVYIKFRQLLSTCCQGLVSSYREQ